MREYPFDDPMDNGMKITINDQNTNTYIEKTIDEEHPCWTEVVMDFLSMLQACGYIIDIRKVERDIKGISTNSYEDRV